MPKQHSQHLNTVVCSPKIRVKYRIQKTFFAMIKVPKRHFTVPKKLENESLGRYLAFDYEVVYENKRLKSLARLKIHMFNLLCKFV